jgi:hypothetical protein
MWRSSVGFLVVAGLMEVQKVRRVGTGRREKERRAPWRWIQSGAWRWTAPIGRVGAVGRRRIRILCRKSFYGRGAVVAIATVCWHPMLAGSLTVLSLPSSLTANSISLSAPSLSKFPTPLGSVISLSLAVGGAALSLRHAATTCSTRVAATAAVWGTGLESSD